MNYSKLSNLDIEAIARRGGKAEAEMKALGFKERARHAREAMNNTDGEERLSFLKQVEADSIRIYRKYKDKF